MWISVKKKLPAALKDVLVTIKHQGRYWMSLAWVDYNKNWNYSDNCEEISKKFKIIAWQPLPEAYEDEKKWQIKNR